METSRQDLIDFRPQHSFFVGIDSDGCVFDSMEPKHKECFCPVTVEKWKLAPISRYVREVWDFVNRSYRHGGWNLSLGTVKVWELLGERTEGRRRDMGLP